MHHTLLIAAFVVGIGVAGVAQAEYKPYPGAKADAALQKKSVQEAHDNVSIDATATSLLSTDSFEKVVAFYQKVGKEFKLPQIPGLWGAGYERGLPAVLKFGPKGIETEPSGVTVKMAHFMLDDAANIEDSKDSLTITSPVVLDVKEENGRMVYSNIIKGTSIVRLQLK
jgi:hypothetical protein